MTVSLVGYTNAGKSTLMNALTDAGVLAEDKLFATLDTRTRRWQLPGWGPVLLSDTVGFIRDLPHRLIASFKATLEEARQADLLMHVADASSPGRLRTDRRRVHRAGRTGDRREGHLAGAQQEHSHHLSKSFRDLDVETERCPTAG
jgi:GTP-binding protein HflX